MASSKALMIVTLVLVAGIFAADASQTAEQKANKKVAKSLAKEIRRAIYVSEVAARANATTGNTTTGNSTTGNGTDTNTIGDGTLSGSVKICITGIAPGAVGSSCNVETMEAVARFGVGALGADGSPFYCVGVSDGVCLQADIFWGNSTDSTSAVTEINSGIVSSWLLSSNIQGASMSISVMSYTDAGLTLSSSADVVPSATAAFTCVLSDGAIGVLLPSWVCYDLA